MTTTPIRIRLFARARELAGRGEFDMIGGPFDTAAFRVQLGRALPELRSFLERCAIAVNESLADEATVIQAGDEVAILPPVSGGSQ